VGGICNCGVHLPVQSVRKLRFATFELDRQTAELRKSGIKLKLRGQPIAVLSLLLERPGELVTREELRRHLWPEDTFVDFEHSLNTHIKKLRQVLDDNAEAPRYIETLPRRGYRFIASVEVVNNGNGALALAVNDLAQSLADCPPAPFIVTSLPVRPPHDSAATIVPARWKRFVAGAVVLTIAIAALYWLYRPRTPFVTGIHQLTHSGHPKSLMGLHRVVTDGTRVYFDEFDGDTPRIAQVSARGGDVSYLDTPLIRNPLVVDISHDGSELLVLSALGHKESAPGQKKSVFWIVQLPSGQAQRIPDLADGLTWMQFLPGTNQITYVKQNQLYAANRDGTGAHRLVDFPAKYSTLLWAQYAISPDAKMIRFPGRLWQIWQSNLDGTGLRPFLPNFPYAMYGGGWSRDGKLYLFDQLVYTASSLWAVTERRFPFRTFDSKPVQLTNGPLAFPAATASNDGKQIFAVGQSLRGELNIYDAATREFRPFLGGMSGGFIDHSPDGQWITYVSFPDGTLWRCRVNGGERQQLTTPAIGVIFSPRWSPDGRFILFNAWQVDRRIDDYKKIYMIPAEGGAPLLLVSGNFQPADASWSPDGKSIAYGGASGVGDASEARILDVETRQTHTVPGSKSMFGPRWSPDGRYLVAQSGDAKRTLLYSFATSQWRELPTPADSTEMGWPTWSHDSRYVYAMSNAHKIYRYRISDGREEEVADAGQMPLLSPVFGWGWWFQLTPDDHIVVLVDRGTDELYALDLDYR
jgi:DNA-binding winged helix-turn-helix (wHTH) protein/Tol biopolymer transport system component